MATRTIVPFRREASEAEVPLIRVRRDRVEGRYQREDA